MCGITGFFSYKNKCNTENYYEAHLKLLHRGPDDEGFIYKNNDDSIECLKGNDTIDEYQNVVHISAKPPSSLIFGHRRLSIIDLTSHGHQPFVFENLYLVYNGEIYNYIELKDELKNLGYSFQTNTDTEVFLKAYHCWGKDAFGKFNGMWSCAVYDEKKDEVLLCRDRFGIKPLYYSFIDGSLIFGSEIKFVASFFDSLKVNEQIAYEYLRFNYSDHTKETFFENIMQVEPNSYMIFNRNGLSVNRYWSIEEEKISGEEIEKRLKAAIGLRLRSDVEVGSLLSGGVDSSVILGIIDQNKLSKSFQTFSAVFDEEKYSEKSYVDIFNVKHININKHFIYPSPQQLPSMMDDLIYTQEEPFRSLAVYSQYEIYKNIKRDTKVKVLLNGQGADEIFAGYSKYYYIYLFELLLERKMVIFWNELNALSINQNLSRVYILKRIFIDMIGRFFRKSDKYGIFKKSFHLSKPHRRFSSLLKNSLWDSLTFSALREYLRYEDRNSMQHSLESRLPFLDYNLVNGAFSLPNTCKIRDGSSKFILREIAKGKIPDKILSRKDKMGFVSPQELWQKDILKNEFDEVFIDIHKNGLFGFIDHERVYEIYVDYTNEKFNDWAFIWRIYCLYKWKKHWRLR